MSHRKNLQWVTYRLVCVWKFAADLKKRPQHNGILVPVLARWEDGHVGIILMISHGGTHRSDISGILGSQRFNIAEKILNTAHFPGISGTFSCASRVCWDACRNWYIAVTGNTLPAYPVHAQPAILGVWQEAHGKIPWTRDGKNRRSKWIWNNA